MEHGQLKKLLKLLRESGVTSYKTPELELVLEPAPSPQPSQPSLPDSLPTEEELTPEQLMFYSAPTPEEQTEQ